MQRHAGLEHVRSEWVPQRVQARRARNANPQGMHLRPRTRIREDKAMTEQSTQVDEGNPLPEPPQLPPEPEPEPETFPRSYVEEFH